MSFLSRLSQWLPFGDVPEMDVNIVFKHLENNKIQMVDVRSALEWDKSHIKGAINLPITHFSADLVKQLQLNTDHLTIVICLSAHRSIPAVRKLQQFGFKEVYQLKGGMLSWWKAKLPTLSTQEK
ncbi:rhodanese-like domain-containing protein [Shewanella metallivivens]|uniref:Rhodanese-like domain-containing protein n=1 Tax=Shewanella metallivivens TaxID=2872342 RepID=A0ABT5TKV3_9GAMM|nr:rhodanese-like domain-containing protein [Shewanella metallivivens]MDD8059244.1 rhodanese-like domain-containing protein [Shewanella metallivivens]